MRLLYRDSDVLHCARTRVAGHPSRQVAQTPSFDSAPPSPVQSDGHALICVTLVDNLRGICTGRW
jgi:hypothetical protein